MDGGFTPTLAPEGGVLLALLRGMTVAGMLSCFGILLFRVTLPGSVEGVAAEPLRRRWRAALRWSAAITLGGGLLWLVRQAGAMADARSAAEAVAAAPVIVAATAFGHVIAGQLTAVLLVLLIGDGRPMRMWASLGLAAIAVVLQAAHGHGLAMAAADGPDWLAPAEALHLLAAGAWLGGLVPLWMLIGATTPDAAQRACRRFSWLGSASVLVLAATAAGQFDVLIGGLPGLVGTGYGWIASVKLCLFATLLALAALHRFRFTPALAGRRGMAATRHLRRSIAMEASLGLLVVLAAGWLTSLQPAMHMQPVWPFSKQLSLEAVREDAGFRTEAAAAVLAITVALLLALAIPSARPFRWTSLCFGALIVWLAAPHLDLLLAEAHPTSFFRSPTGFAAAAIAEGARLYPRHCAACHGLAGRGDGLAAAGLPVPPADLTAPHLWMHPDGELFWWLTHGIDAPEGGMAMPGFETSLSEDQRWDLIDYIRAHNGGLVFHETGAWSPPLRAPGWQADCGGRATTLADLQGRFVLLAFGSAALPPPGAEPAVVLAAQSPLAGRTDVCSVADEDVAEAYAVAAGVPAASLARVLFLIDGGGWLRAMHRLGEGDDWSDPATLASVIAGMRAHPLAPAPDTMRGMKM